MNASCPLPSTPRQGYTELTLTSLADHDLSTIRLHCRQCHVDSVRVDGVNITDFIHRDHLGAMPVVDAGDRDAGDGDASGGSMAGANNTDGGTRDARMHPRFKEEFVAALVRASHGELVVRLPQTSMEVVKKDNAAAGDTATGEADAAVTSEEAVAAAGDADASAFAPDSPITSTTTPTSRDIILRVDFTLTDPAIGAFFCNPGTASSAAITHPYVYTCNQYLQSRAWFPCVDEPTERCTWSMEYVVPRFYNGGEGGGGNDGAGDDTRDWIVVSAGEIQEQVGRLGAAMYLLTYSPTHSPTHSLVNPFLQVVHPHDPAKKIVFYQSTVPIPAQSILFVLAPFAVVPIPGFPYGACAGYAFCMPGKERMVEESLGFLAKVRHGVYRSFGFIMNADTRTRRSFRPWNSTRNTLVSPIHSVPLNSASSKTSTSHRSPDVPSLSSVHIYSMGTT